MLSYLVLRGKCSACGTAIGLRYPLVELATAALFFFSVRHWGATPAGGAWCVFSAAIVALALIDWDTTLLPDDITLPLLWAGSDRRGAALERRHLAAGVVGRGGGLPVACGWSITASSC